MKIFRVHFSEVLYYHFPWNPRKSLKMDLTKPEAISFGQSGSNIGTAIGRSIEAEREMGLGT
jgi:hypothetical protein